MKKVISFVFAPSAFKLGVLITLGFLYLANTYYNTPPELLSSNKLLKFINEAHNKSTDYRLIIRGQRAGSDEVAIIAVDEPSLEVLGRWPWPRSKIAAMIERLRGYGAKVIGFDAVFSEPEINPAMRTLAAIKESGMATPELNQMIEKELEASNSDLILAKTIEKHADHLVMGAYFDYREDQYYPYQEYCGNIIDTKTPEYKLLENEERPVIALDENTYEPPAELIEKVELHLTNIEAKMREEVASQKLSLHEKVDLEKNILKAQRTYCDNWLIEGKDTELNQVRGPASTFDPTEFMYSVLKNNVLRTGKWWTNVPVLAQGTKHTGFFNAFLDSDGSIRTATLVTRYGNQYFASLALKSVMIAKNLGAILTLNINPVDPNAKSVKELVLTDLETGEPVETIPVDSQGRVAINYNGPRYTFPHLGVGELFNGKDTAKIAIYRDGKQEVREVNKIEFIKDKIFLFGATATGIYDLRVTPFEENFPGLEIHANIVDNILRKDYLKKPSDEAPYMLASLGVIGISLSAVISFLGAVIGLIVAVLAILGIYFADKMLLFQDGTVITILFPFMLVGALYVGLTFYKYLTEERKKKELKGTFAKYVSPSIVNEILKDPGNIELGGKKQRMTVMFSDLRGFTTISEKLDPTKLSDILNRYLTPMTKLVFDNKGTLDKYMGDAIMSFFGAPISYPEHAKMACRCALQMMDKLQELRKEFAAEGLPDIDIGIGVNTGDMSVGNMGSDIVRSYTVMGDAVNLGSRLEGINKEYGTHVIISEFTYEEVKNDFICREIDWVKVKGKHLPVKIYELISEKTAEQKVKDKINHFAEGFKLYHEKSWDKAIDAFQMCLQIDPDDTPSRLYLTRCTNYKETPPPPDWDGVFQMKTK